MRFNATRKWPIVVELNGFHRVRDGAHVSCFLSKLSEGYRIALAQEESKLGVFCISQHAKAIGHFRVAVNLTMKARLSAEFFR